jgi:RNA polymerase sigma-70 factor, ECF subfamily
VVYLTFFEDLPYPEIARILEIPEGTVKTRMFHARKSLAHCLEGLGARL